MRMARKNWNQPRIENPRVRLTSLEVNLASATGYRLLARRPVYHSPSNHQKDSMCRIEHTPLPSHSPSR